LPDGIPEVVTRYGIPGRDGLVGPDLRFPLRDLFLLIFELFVG
jgi:hypothetical protein